MVKKKKKGLLRKVKKARMGRRFNRALISISADSDELATCDLTITTQCPCKAQHG